MVTAIQSEELLKVLTETPGVSGYEAAVRKVLTEHLTPLASVIVEGANARRSAGDTVIYHLEGGTAQDLFVATWGYNWARERGLGRPFDLSV